MSRLGTTTRRLVALASAAGLLATALAVPASADPSTDGTARLELLKGGENVTMWHGKKEPVYLDTGALLASHDAAFELRITRPLYTEDPDIALVRHHSGGDEVIPLPDGTFTSWWGLEKFLRVIVSKDGDVVTRKWASMCPNSYERQRLNDDGPTSPVYPDGCYGNPFTKGMVWGIEKNWAMTISPWNGPMAKLKDGEYQVTTRIAEPYKTLFDIADGDHEVTVNATVKSYNFDCEYKCGGFGRKGASYPAERPYAAVPDDLNPDVNTLPDLQSLPAFGITVKNSKRGSFLRFGANVWTGGAQDLVVEGFRPEGEDYMVGYQYFYENGEPVGRAEVGTLEFDDRKGHQHWHFLQFAGYSLIGDGIDPVRSKKEAFCLAATDAIDLTLPNARLRTEVGLGTQCGSPNSIWIREILPLGWGDTYFQSRAGQSFNITDLPNGEYQILVDANPEVGGERNLFESDYTNNTSLRTVILKGPKGARRVEVPPYEGIDTEGGGGFFR